MRLSEFEIQSIKQAFDQVFGEGEIYLFGSRIFSNQKGGGIDLYIVLDNHENLSEKKINFISKVITKIGEQKIDVIFNLDENRLIEQEAKNNMVKLDINRLKLEKYFKECDKHVLRIGESYEDLKECMPLSADSYAKLDKKYVQAIDQYLFRFSKLQDTIGNKVFKTIMSIYEDNIQEIPFIDLLNKLEKMEFLTSSKEWTNLRQMRNDISHQYEDEPESMSKSINIIVAHKDVLIRIYIKIKNKYKKDIEKY